MAGAGGKEVGRLSIRVVPDMDGFREKVEAGARGAGKDVVIPVDADTSKARREIHEVADEKYGAVVDLDADTGKARAKIDEATRPRKIDVKVDFNEGALDRVKKNMDRFLTEESLEYGRANQRLQAAMRNFTPQAEAGRRLAQMEQDIKLHPHLDETELMEMKARLASENATMRVKVVMDDQNMQRMARNFGRDVDAIFDRAEKRIAGGSGGGGGRGGGRGGMFGGRGGSFDVLPNIGGLGGVPSVLLIIGALSLLAPALSLVSQALVGLPALVSAVALPIGVFALGMGGIKKALDASGLMELVTGKTNKKGEKTGKDKQTLGEGLKEMQKQVSDVFETGFTPLFRSFAGVLPELTRGLPFVAKGIVDLAGGLTKAIISPENIANFSRFTNSVSTMLTNLGPGLGSFTTGMTTLITNVGDHLPGLGTVMSGWADRFNNWVTEISKPMQAGGKDIPNSSPLDRAVTNMKPILNSVVGFVGTLMDKGIEMASSKSMTDSIVGTIDGLLGLIERALPALKSTFDTLANGMKLFGMDTHGYGDVKDHAAGHKPWGLPDGSEQKPPDVKPSESNNKHNWFAPFGAMENIVDAAGRLPQNLLKDSGLDKLFGGIWNTLGMGQAAAESTPFNAGARAPGGVQAPVPVVPVAPPGSAGLGGLFPGAGGPVQAPKAPPPPVAPTGVGTAGAAPPPIQAPKIEAPKLPPGSEKLWEPVIQSTQAAGAQIGAEVDSWSGKIKSALDSAAAGANASGVAIGTQMAAGIAAGAPSAIAAARALAQAVKDVLPHSPAPDPNSPFGGSGWHQVKTSGEAIANQFADGLDGGFEGVRSASQRLAQSVHDSMTQNGGILPPGLSAAVKRESAAIGIELDKLKQQKDALDPKDKGGRAAIQAQMKELQSLRTDLGMNDKQSKYDAKYGGAGDGEGPFNQQNVGSLITQGLASALNAMVGFPKANLSQLEQDLGMSGNGVVEQLGDYGLNFLTGTLNSLATGFFGGGKDGQGGGGSTYNFHSMDHDGMMQDYARVKNRESMQFTQRTN
jgi:hypothetical protein